MIDDIDVEKTVKQYRPFGCFPVETNMSVKSLAKAFKNLAESDEAGQLQLNGILISACSENETAAASTSLTTGLSAFTYCFGTAIATLPQSSSIQDLVAESNRLLKSMGFRQTPMVKANPENVNFRRRWNCYTIWCW